MKLLKISILIIILLSLITIGLVLYLKPNEITPSGRYAGRIRIKFYGAGYTEPQGSVYNN